MGPERRRDGLGQPAEWNADGRPERAVDSVSQFSPADDRFQHLGAREGSRPGAELPPRPLLPRYLFPYITLDDYHFNQVESNESKAPFVI